MSYKTLKNGSNVDIVSGGTNNYVMTAVDSNSIQGEENLQFDGTDLTLKDDKTVALGTGSDSKIYYDGTNTLWDLQAAGTGKLRLLVDSNNKSDNYVEIGEYSANNVQIKGGKAGAYNLSLSSNLSTYFNVDAGGSGASSFFYFAHEGEGSDSTVIAKLSDAAVLTMYGTAGSGADTAIVFDGEAVDYHVGLDDTADDLVIGVGSTLGTTPAIEINAASGISLGGGARPSADSTVLINRTYTAAANSAQLTVSGTLTGDPGNTMQAVRILSNTLVEAGSGTHGLAAGLSIYAPSLTTAGSATTTDAATLYVDGAMSGASNNYALMVGSTIGLFNSATTVSSGDDVGVIQWITKDTSTQGAGAIAQVRAEAASNFTGARAGDLVFSTAHSAGTTFTPVDRMRIGSRAGTDGAIVTIDAAATSVTKNAGMTTGLTIDQGAYNDEILAFKSSDVAHGMTDETETDNFAMFSKVSGAAGGLLVRGVRDSGGIASGALFLQGFLGEAANTQTDTGSHGVVEVDSQVKTSATVEAVHADGNIFTVSNAGTCSFLVKGDGELFSNESATVGTFDSYDDAQLIRALDHARQSPTMIQERWDDFIKYNEQDLVEAGILGDTVENGGLLNVTGLQRLHNGAIWQGYTRQMEMQERIDTLEQKLLVLEGAR